MWCRPSLEETRQYTLHLFSIRQVEADDADHVLPRRLHLLLYHQVISHTIRLDCLAIRYQRISPSIVGTVPRSCCEAQCSIRPATCHIRKGRALLSSQFSDSSLSPYLFSMALSVMRLFISCSSIESAPSGVM